MAELTIRLVVDRETGKKNVEIHYESELDALPFEHEAEHRRIVDALVRGGTLKADELGQIVVTRGEGHGAVEEDVTEAAPSRERARERG